MGQLSEAERELQVALRAAPENLAAQREMGELYRRDGRPAEALARFRAALSLAPRDAELAEIVAELERTLPAIVEAAPAPPPPTVADHPPPDETALAAATPLFRRPKDERLRSTLEQWLTGLQARRPHGT
jgi:tetratricopeptide (TPR) repeat protein